MQIFTVIAVVEKKIHGVLVDKKKKKNNLIW